MQYLILISVLALSLKLLALWNVKALICRASPYAIAISLAFVVMNLCELSGFYFANKEGSGFPLLITYYGFALLATHAMLALALSNTLIKFKWWLYPLATSFLCIELILLTPGAAIAGIQSIGYSASRIPGIFYPVIQFGLLAPLIAMVAILVFTFLNSKDRDRQLVAKTYLFAFSPLAVVAVLVVTLMACGVQINASGFVSLTVCITMWALIFASTRRNQYVFLSFIPMTREHKSVYSVATNLACPENGLKQALLELESRIIEETLAKTAGNITHASEILGIGRSTLSQKVTKFGIGDSAKS